MSSNLDQHLSNDSPSPLSEISVSTSRLEKKPRQLLDGLFAFPPNRETLGGTSYLIVENGGNILLDAPAFLEVNQRFLQEIGVRWWFFTHRGNHGKSVKALQSALNCEILVQEQEAYLLPEIPVTPFRQEIILSPDCYGFWTSGHSPGSACLYWKRHQGVLFSGRHLMPNQQGEPMPLRTAKTFHWPRQLRNVKKISDRFSNDSLSYLCPGANTGFLRGKGLIEQPLQYICTLDLDLLSHAPAIF
ncbi:MBL fold metallo-hydrolase [Aphanothece hegewaldii CCALA 016]|uniref:MBL fold metallo-hydrolase n=1 Tax=Aphanothece hegewaldii CCALA 016 TaxID=2107694 RepID=A0A2T1M0V6_9CHRO|nr:MBL fold metallo-hydrolase [Aphanothece hegewaldii]PSF38311.1 MBL fold metallo-hydrolase [Aphanothece hegewaldii CCALA 016]